MSASSSAEAAPAESPFHVLMKDADKQAPRLDHSMAHDFLSRRWRAFHPEGSSEDGTSVPQPFWSGASPLEQALAFCCELPKKGAENKGDDDDEVDVVQGALAREKAARFVGLLALHCHDLPSRALAIAILERTLEEDNYAAMDAKVLSNLEELDDKKPPAVDNEERPSKRSRTEKGTGASTTKESDEQPSSKPEPKPSRMNYFEAAGGLRILCRWLYEARTPVVVSKPKPPPGSTTSSSGRQLRKPAAGDSSTTQSVSPAGPLLLVLLELLTNMSVDFKLVRQSKINKEIRLLGKQLDGINVDSSDQTDPLAGGLSVEQVKAAVEKLMQSWRSREKASKAGGVSKPATPPPDPFANIKSKLQERMQEMAQFDNDDTGESTKPAWMDRAEASLVKKKEKQRKKGMSMEELAKREREAEKREIVKKDIEKTQKARAEVLKKLQKIQHQASLDEQAEQRSRARRTVKWRDGLGAASVRSKPEMLEEVFIFDDSQDGWPSKGRPANEEEDEGDDSVFATAEEEADGDLGNSHL